MTFRKTGDASLEKVFCSCGGEVVNGRCTKCGNEFTAKPTKIERDETKKEKPE